VRPDGVVVISPKGQLSSRIIEVFEYLLIQELVAQTAVERLDEGILLRIPRVDVMPRHIVLVGPSQDGPACELRPVLTDDATWFSVDPHRRVQLAGDTSSRDTGVSHQAQVFAAAIVDHRQNAELA
jgi:hypothetical protein